MKYFALLTKLGENLLAQATALGTKIELTHMAVGDGGGSLPTPDTNQTKLVKEQRRAAINTLFIDEKNKNQIVAEQIIPEKDGGWWIREIGLFDKDGNLVAVANCPETYKPQLAEGSGRTQSIRMVL
ncbi:phage tail protein, partial [Providencia manganoxydans]|uniref:phage tail protein n=1 Tax=Providencia manganoxydans TaxID=2923283 RepID=UPI0034E436F9